MLKLESQDIGEEIAIVKRADNLVFTGLCLLVFALAIPFGGVDLWSRMLFSAGAGTLLLAWTAAHLFSFRPLPFRASKILLPALLFLSVCFWGVIQTAQFVPPDWQHPIWLQASQTLEQGFPGHVSINPEVTRQGVISLVTMAVVFWLALQLGRNARRAELGIKFIAVSTAALALYGIVNFLGEGSHILWMEKRFYLESVTGTFVNRNSFATLCGLGLICSVALLVDRSSTTFQSRDGKFRSLLKFLEELFSRKAIYLLSSVVLLTALLLTQSRAGNASAVIGFCALVVSMTRAGKIKVRHTIVATLILAPVLGVIIGVSGSGLGSRLPSAAAFDLEGRKDLYMVTIDAIRDRPYLGSGLGTYREAIYPYLTDDLLTDRSWFDAHNTYLEKALELGLPAATALFATILLLTLSCWRGLRRRRRNHVYPAIAVSASCLIAAHSLLDFSVEIPAIAASFALLLGIGVAQSFSSSRSG